MLCCLWKLLYQSWTTPCFPAMSFRRSTSGSISSIRFSTLEMIKDLTIQKNDIVVGANDTKVKLRHRSVEENERNIENLTLEEDEVVCRGP